MIESGKQFPRLPNIIPDLPSRKLTAFTAAAHCKTKSEIFSYDDVQTHFRGVPAKKRCLKWGKFGEFCKITCVQQCSWHISTLHKILYTIKNVHIYIILLHFYELSENFMANRH